MNSLSSISVVIPTRNRLASLNRVLLSIAKQTHAPKEIIIVDSSDCPLEVKELTVQNSVQIIHSKPSVCLQKNIGIEKSTSDYIFLCDDDIEVSDNYCKELANFLDTHKKETIASGLLLENDHGNWTYCEMPLSLIGLVTASIFGFSVGFDANSTELNSGFWAKRIIRHYKCKGNVIAKSGWPIIVNFGGDNFQTPIYGLGASVIRTKALKKVRFDEVFFAHGIGDNYDLAIGLNAEVNVLKEAKAYHHRETTNRMPNKKAYSYRIHALHYILKKHRRFNNVNLLYFCWSLIGKSLVFLSKGKFKSVYYNLEVMLRILCNRPLYKVKH